MKNISARVLRVVCRAISGTAALLIPWPATGGARQFAGADRAAVARLRTVCESKEGQYLMAELLQRRE
jgi:hypothetical protein